MVPKNSGLYPPSEYKENYTPMPIIPRPQAYKPTDGSPMGLQTEKSTVGWKSQYNTDFIPLDENKAESERVAGSLPLEDVGKLAPSFFAWDLVDSSDANLPPPPPPERDDSLALEGEITEYQEQFSWVPPEPVQQISLIERTRYKADLLGIDSTGSKDWKTEAQDAQESTERAKQSLNDSTFDPYIAGNKHMVVENHPDYFAWSRVDSAPENGIY
jgi:hypothetical protein